MNEEWFGICAKGTSDNRGLYALYPRAAYYVLQNVHQFNPYSEGISSNALTNHFGAIRMADAELRARGDKAALVGESSKKIRINRFTSHFTTFSTGGSLITTPKAADPQKQLYPDKQGFDHMESFFVGIEANPAPNMRAKVDFNVLGNVAKNPIDQIFYENRGRPVTVIGPDGQLKLESINRVQVYQASYEWNHKLFDLNGFYRTGHYHWGYEGDFFGLYPEANYGPNIDIYNGLAPLGFEITGKKQLRNFKVAFGPQLWWGANPAILLKYSKEIAKFKVTGIFHEDLQQQGLTGSSFAIPQPKTRRATMHVARKFGKLGVDFGGIWGGQPLVGRDIQVAREVDGETRVFQDKIKASDTWGGKAKLTYAGGKFNWYAQTAAMGLVAFGSTADASNVYRLEIERQW